MSITLEGFNALSELSPEPANQVIKPMVSLSDTQLFRLDCELTLFDKFSMFAGGFETLFASSSQ